MNKSVIRLAGGFIVILGLAYLGNQVFVQPGPGARSTSARGTSAAVTGGHGYVVYPDRDTEKELGLDYPTFNGSFVNALTVTPLPPHLPGTALLRGYPG